MKKVDTADVLKACQLLCPATTTKIAAYLKIAPTTARTHVARLKEEGEVHLRKHPIHGQPTVHLGFAERPSIRNNRTEREVLCKRRPGTLAEVPPKQFWWSTTL
jgi:predicted ArsR family transcriptional regulator